MSELSSRPRTSDQFYDALGRRGHYRPCHSTADLIFTQNTNDGEARIYQGGYLRANDIAFLTEISIALVVNVTSNIPALTGTGNSAHHSAAASWPPSSAMARYCLASRGCTAWCPSRSCEAKTY